MFSRIATKMLLNTVPLLTLGCSLLFTAPAGSQGLHLLSAPGVALAGRSVAGRYVVLYRGGEVPANAQTAAAMAGARVIARHDVLGLAVLDHVSDAARVQLALDPNVETVVPDVLLQAHAIRVRVTETAAHLPAADSFYHSPQGWAVRQVGGFGEDGSPMATKGPWDVSKGRGVRVAILDSGVDPTHPDIAPNLALNLSEVDQTALPSACDDGSPVDQQGHGTWTASLAAGALGHGTGLVAGVAPEATLLNIKVMQRMAAVGTAADPSGCLAGQSSGLMSWVLQGIEDAMANRANVISLSLGTLVDVTTGDGAGLQAVFNRATHAAAQAGAVIIAAAGNDAVDLSGGRYVELPAQSRDVLAIVASTNPACAEDLERDGSCAAGAVTVPYYSNFGSSLHAFAAPGGSYPDSQASGSAIDASTVTGWVTGACSSGRQYTLSGVPDATHSLGCFNLGHAAYVQAIGTSASAPLVAGAAALILALHPDWTASQIVTALRASASPATASLNFPQVSVASLFPSISH